MRLEEAVKRALAEDVGRGDVTSLLCIPPARHFRAVAVAREKGVLCGVAAAELAFKLLDKRCKVRLLKKDGQLLKPGDRILTVEGGRSLLASERVALNFMQRLSGIASAARACVKALAGSRAAIFDTRKTTPLLREQEKYAVRCGGGRNHRFGLYDAVLVKNNHIDAAGWESVRRAAAAARKRKGVKFIEIEARTLREVSLAISCGPDIILLDNMSPAQVRRAVALVRKHGGRKPELEISGGINLKNLRAYAKLGAQRISCGALTHSAAALDISLRIQ